MNDIAAWTERILALRRALEYPAGHNVGERWAMADKLAEEAREMRVEADRAGSTPHGPHRERLRDETGDVLVMAVAILASHGYTLTDAMQAAEDKLTARVAAKREG